MNAQSDWTTDANEALRLCLVRAKDDKSSLSPREAYEGFHPTFSYPIYGEDEKIYGYKNLVIDLRFASGSLAQYLNVSYSAKLPSSSTVDDVEGTLAKFIPEDYETNIVEFQSRVESEAISFKPFGEKIYSYSRPSSLLSLRKSNGNGSHSHINGKGEELESNRIEPISAPGDEEVVEFEVYRSTWNTPGFREYHRRMQLFILLYIEGGSYIKEDEEGWEFYVLYEKRRRVTAPISDANSIWTYHFVGYSSLYPFYCFPEKVRMRLSQFVIVPPYQQEGHGSALYSAIYNYVLTQPNIAELTVEDPAEAFEDLRDRNDLKMLLNHNKFMDEAFGEGPGVSEGHRVGQNGYTKKKGKGKMGPPVEKAWVEKQRCELKIAGRQFHRLIEMLQLKYLDSSDQRAMRAYRLQVKERLYRFNYEVLMQLEKQERQQKLEETFQSVCKDYKRILAMVQ